MRKATIIGMTIVGFLAAWWHATPRSVKAIDPDVSTVKSQPALKRQPGPPESEMPADRRSIADLVVVVSIDGLRPDVVTPATRALHRMYLQGAHPRSARTIDKSATLPSHASMLSGFPTAEHGINFNAYKPERGHIQRPTLFSVAHAAQLPVTMFVGKLKLKHLLTSSKDADFHMAGMHCDNIVSRSQTALREAERGVFFLHFSDPDSAGHRSGWMTTEYMEAVHKADRCLDKVLDTLEEKGNLDRTLLLVTADHGGHNRSHGTRLEVDQRIPWYAWGAGVRRGRFHRTINTMDTAATAMFALGLTAPDGMQGQAALDAFRGALGPVGLPLIGAPLEVDDDL